MNTVAPSTVVRPPALHPGDRIGLIATGSPVHDPRRIDAAVEYFHRKGHPTIIGAHAKDVSGFLAGNDSDRAADLHAMIADERVHAIVCLRGGYGTTRLLPLLDFDLFRAHPKIIVGFSDVTALQLALWNACRMVTFHGPMAAVDFANDIDSTTEKSFWEMLTGAANETTVRISDAISHDTRRGGVANGRLLGGNLSLLAAMTGTPYFPDFTNAILMIEEVEEEPYRIDRMLTQLSQSGAFSLISGIVGGQFTGCIPRDPSHPSQSAEDILADFAGQHAVPYVSSAQFGHVPLKLTLPIGLSVRLNSNSGSLTFCESAVL